MNSAQQELPRKVGRFVCMIAILSAASSFALAADPPQTASDYVRRGMDRFRANNVAGSIEDFKQAAKLEPQSEPHLWQLGISYYYSGDFKPGRELFELHKSVNPHDVENAAWHYLCVARQLDPQAARKALIKIDTTRDTRIPMAQVYRLYAGDGSADAVLKAAEAVEKSADAERARMYAHLYLGLYYEVHKKAEKAREHMRQSAAAKLKQHYMHDVAKVHLLQRKWKP